MTTPRYVKTTTPGSGIGRNRASETRENYGYPSTANVTTPEILHHRAYSRATPLVMPRQPRADETARSRPALAVVRDTDQLCPGVIVAGSAKWKP
jgi:hypothetical protein